MDIVWHAHNAVVSARLKGKAEASVAKVAKRLSRPVGADIRFEREGTRCRVELLLHAPRHKALVAEGYARYYGPALSVALDHLAAQVAAERRTAKDRAKRTNRT